MRKGIVMTMLCVMLCVMPVHATQLTDIVNETEESQAPEEPQLPEESQVAEEPQIPEESQASKEPQVPEESQMPEEPQAPEESQMSEESQIPEESQLPEETQASEEILIEIPEVIHLQEEEALKSLQEVVLPEGFEMEIIKEYVYSAEAAENIVFMQDPVGVIAVEDDIKIHLTISMGEEPVEEVNTGLNGFGIGGPVNPETTSKYGIDWSALPHSFEYNWDNSQNCWYNGVWVDGVKYTTPEGTYDTNVRHKIQVHCDGENVYLHIIFSRDYEAAANGNNYVFTIDGQQAVFQIEMYDGKQLTNNTLDPGTYQVNVIHANSDISTHTVDGGSAYFTVFDSKVNADLEIKIPLSEMARQNPEIDAEQIGAITFTCPNLAYNSVTASGASTFPFALAVVAFILVPGSVLYASKKRMQER